MHQVALKFVSFDRRNVGHLLVITKLGVCSARPLATALNRSLDALDELLLGRFLVLELHLDEISLLHDLL